MRFILVIVLYLIFAGLLYLSSYLFYKDKSFLFSGCNFLILA